MIHPHRLGIFHCASGISEESYKSQSAGSLPFQPGTEKEERAEMEAGQTETEEEEEEGEEAEEKDLDLEEGEAEEDLEGT